MTDDSPANGNGSNSTNSNPAAEAEAGQDFGLHDRFWSDEQWHELVISLVERNIADWRELAALILGHLNPSQVGTSLASSDGFKRRYGKARV